MLLTLGAVAGLGAGIAWGLLGAGRMTVWVLALAALMWVACSASAGLFWTRSPRGNLVWSGSHWSFEYATGAMQHGTLGIHMDLQTCLWICFRPQSGGARWLWLEQPSAPECWSDLRRAVYSRAGSTAADALSRDNSA